jgi:hypothetical protein
VRFRSWAPMNELPVSDDTHLPVSVGSIKGEVYQRGRRAGEGGRRKRVAI